MPAANLPTATVEEQFEQKDGKDPLKIRVAIFFDGTLNNRLNIEEREKDELGRENKAKAEFRKDPSNSYDNGRTNIAIMEPHVDKTADGYDYFFKHYVEGQGTFTYGKDSMWGYALAIGESGVPWRAESGIRKAVESIANHPKILSDQYYISKLTIDVFGFSRGAATARYAIHVIFQGRIANVDDYGNVTYEFRPMAQRLRESMLQTEDSAVQVQFVGLYDTVLSYMASQKVGWTTNALQQSAVSRAKKVLHLAAADEHREDFPLHRIVSAVKKGVGEEYFLPGVHSDVGGSYNLANQIQIREAKTESDRKKLYMRTTKEGNENAKLELNWKGDPKNGVMVINENDDLKYIKQDRDDLIAQGWYTKDQIKINKLGSEGDGEWVWYALSVWRENINSAYNNIPLKIMAKYAREQKIQISDDLETVADAILEPYPVLAELEGKIDEYIKSHKNTSKPGDWIDDDGEQNSNKLKEIRHGYFHFSASKWSAGYKPNFEWDEKAWKFRRRRYYYNA